LGFDFITQCKKILIRLYPKINKYLVLSKKIMAAKKKILQFLKKFNIF